MSVHTTVRMLYDEMCSRAQLNWVAGRRGANRTVKQQEAKRGSSSLLGHLNLIHENQVQVIGKDEMRYLQQLKPNMLQDIYAQIFRGRAVLLVFCDEVTPPGEMITSADRHNLAIMSSGLTSFELMAELRNYFNYRLAERTHTHGVFLEVMGIGVLITGEAGMGKSELALELISRGHRLIADDSPLLARIAPDILRGSCPDMLQDFLEVRGLGVLNIRAMYGDNAIKQQKYLRLIIHLCSAETHQAQEMDRLNLQENERAILGVSIPHITLPVAPGRNMGVMIEAAARNHQLKLNGYNATDDFIQRQREQMDDA